MEHHNVIVTGAPYGEGEIAFTGTIPACRTWSQENLQDGQTARIWPQGSDCTGYPVAAFTRQDGEVNECNA